MEASIHLFENSWPACSNLIGVNPTEVVSVLFASQSVIVSSAGDNILFFSHPYESVAQRLGASFLRQPRSKGYWFHSQPNLVVASLDEILHDNYLCLECLVESSKQQIKQVRSIIQPKSSETRATPKRVWIGPKHSAKGAETS